MKGKYLVLESPDKGHHIPGGPAQHGRKLNAREEP